MRLEELDRGVRVRGVVVDKVVAVIAVACLHLRNGWRSRALRQEAFDFEGNLE
ncbi:hypothetical protein [Plantactinospora sp. WMMB782]|uniref:hypothetical protein n=1 Tax=Plantactinospora sp. WMMB782 TaxID=3404121 RepID=UPI003B94465B